MTFFIVVIIVLVIIEISERRRFHALGRLVPARLHAWAIFCALVIGLGAQLLVSALVFIGWPQ